MLHSATVSVNAFCVSLVKNNLGRVTKGLVQVGQVSKVVGSRSSNTEDSSSVRATVCHSGSLVSLNVLHLTACKIVEACECSVSLWWHLVYV